MTETRQAQHTPGPWAPMNDGPDASRDPWHPWVAFREAGPGGLTVASPANTEPVCRVSYYLQPGTPNARLICAAPDLLAACEAALREFDKCTVFDANGSPFEALREAIAKARGQA